MLIVALVLAAGSSTRMGRPKQTLPLLGGLMLERVLRSLRRSKVDKVVVVLGAGAEEIRREVKFKGEKVVLNREYKQGMAESLRLGLKTVDQSATAVMVVLADQPFVTSATIDRLVDAYLATKAPLVVPLYNGERGHPVLFDRRLYPQIMKIRGDVGAKSVVNQNKNELLEVEVKDEGVLIDLDTPEEYRQALSGRRFKPKKSQAPA